MEDGNKSLSKSESKFSIKDVLSRQSRDSGASVRRKMFQGLRGNKLEMLQDFMVSKIGVRFTYTSFARRGEDLKNREGYVLTVLQI